MTTRNHQPRRSSRPTTGPVAHHRPDDDGPDRRHLRRRLLGLDPAYTALTHAAHRLLGAVIGLLGGPWLIAGVVAGLVVRRPGAAFFAEILAAAVSAHHRQRVGLGDRAALRLPPRPRRRDRAGDLPVPPLHLAGRDARRRLGSVPSSSSTSGTPTGRACRRRGSSPTSAASCCPARVVAGVGGWLLVRALAATGAIDALPAGREAAERHRT